jgi:hypothetical protein
MKSKYWFLLSPLVLTGCAAALVPYSSDPNQMLANARSLLDQGRPMPAERLISDALEICQTRQEPVCLAETYRTYGQFFMSSSLNGQWKSHYEQNGFRDRSANYEGRGSKALEYFDKAYPTLLEHKKYDGITNIKLNSGFIYATEKNKGKACASFDESLAANIENERLNPEARVRLPDEYPTYKSFIDRVKQEFGCPELAT